MKKNHIASACLLAGLLSGCIHLGQQASIAQATAEELFVNGEHALASGDYMAAITNFEALDSQYPFSKHSEQAEIENIYAYYMNGNHSLAVPSANRFIHLYPRSQHIDYVYYLKALSNFEQERGALANFLPVDPAFRDPGTASEAYEDFIHLVSRFPNSPYVPDARQRMIFLRNMFARHELHVAEFYMQRRAYVAAVNRANTLIKMYPQAPYALDALHIMIDGNHKMGLEKAAADAERVLHMNYPHV